MGKKDVVLLKRIPIVRKIVGTIIKKKGERDMKKKENGNCIIDKNFFFFDSDSLESVETKLWGYCIANSMIDRYPFDLNDREIPLHYSNGAYVLVQNFENEIFVSQDYNGSYGIFLYEKGGYFAISNSFLYLVEKIKGKVHLTVDLDYMKAHLVAGVCTYAYSETMIKEIRQLPRNVQLVINKITRELKMVNIDYCEQSVEINSPEGMRLLDEWYYKWTALIEQVKRSTDNIRVDLSGGIDSRLVAMLFIKSGIDLNEIRVHSHKDKNHTHEEDYEIASQIADYYGFKLNNKEMATDNMLLRVEDSVNISFYAKQCFHKQMYFRYVVRSTPAYHFTGNGGEFLRAAWYRTPESLTAEQVKKGKRYKYVDFSESMRKIMENAYKETREKFKIEDPEDPKLSQLLYKETRCRHHFGKALGEGFCINDIALAPLMDSNLCRLWCSDTEDKNILVAIIFSRYCPELLNFKFDSGREIAPETIELAKHIISQYDWTEKNIKDMDIDSVIVAGRKLDETYLTAEERASISVESRAETLKYLETLYQSDRVRKKIAKYLHEDVYTYAEKYKKRKTYHPLQEIYAVLGSYIVLEHVHPGLFHREDTMEEILERLK